MKDFLIAFSFAQAVFWIVRAEHHERNKTGVTYGLVHFLLGIGTIVAALALLRKP